MKQKILLAARLLAIAGTSAAADPPRQNFECDTLAGHFSYWNRTVSTATIDITGKLSVNELRKDKKWTPTALVVLESADGKSHFGVHLYTIPKIPESYFIEILKTDGTEKLGLGLIPSTKDPLPFALHLDGAGQLHASFAGFDATMSVGTFKPASVQFSCSTGDFEFKDFVVQEPAAN
jgi:hypothetical protein